MTWALLGFSALCVSSVITLSLLMHSSHKAERAATDHANEWRHAGDTLTAELQLAHVTLQAKDDEIVILKKQLADTQAELNNAEAKAKDEIVEFLRKSNVADAAHLVSQLVATELRPGVLPSKLSDDPKDGLIDPT